MAAVKFTRAACLVSLCLLPGLTESAQAQVDPAAQGRQCADYLKYAGQKCQVQSQCVPPPTQDSRETGRFCSTVPS